MVELRQSKFMKGVYDGLAVVTLLDEVVGIASGDQASLSWGRDAC